MKTQQKQLEKTFRVPRASATPMNPTKKQCSEIAKATKKICDFSGSGHHVVVWPDFSWEEAVDANSAVGRNPYGAAGIEAPLVNLRTPMSLDLVRQTIQEAIEYGAQRNRHDGAQRNRHV